MLFFKQKTAYEMRISDWSSDGRSSDLWAGISSYYFDSRAAAEAFLADPAYQALLEANRDKLPEVTHLLVDEIWMYNRDKCHMPIKAFAFLMRNTSISRQEDRKSNRINSSTSLALRIP